jgi:hypothetical protein
LLIVPVALFSTPQAVVAKKVPAMAAAAAMVRPACDVFMVLSSRDGGPGSSGA